MENLSHAMWSENLNRTFDLFLDESTIVQLELVEVSEVTAGDRNHFFSIFFRGPRDSMLAQGLYKLELEQKGSFEIFLVPVGVDQEGYQYEAVFNLIKQKTSQ